MSSKDQAFFAEKVETFQKTVAYGLLVLSLGYGLEAAQFLTDGSAYAFLDEVSSWLAILVIIIVLPAVLRLAYYKYKFRGVKMETEGYVPEAFQRAAVFTFSLTFVFVMLLDGVLPLNSGVIPEHPPKFYIKGILSFTLGLQSILFLVFNREPSDSDEFKGEDA